MLFRIIACILAVAVLNILPLSGVPRFILFLSAYLLIGYDILRKAALGIINGRVFDENFLMTVATVGAIALAIYDKSGDYNEAVAVMLFYQIGELFQSYAVGKSRRSISSLMDIRPDYANLEIDGRIERIDPSEVECGSLIVVRPGERVPIDGVLVSGEGELDTAALTGESVPRSVNLGDEVLSGSISLSSVLTVRTTKEFGASTVSKILELVENATSRKSRSERFISKFARVYTPAVCIAALVLALLPPLFSLALTGKAPFAAWIYRALTFLVISCPCALVISIPLSFFAGIGGASREGILIKGGGYLEAISRLGCVVFDKTGTLTEGVFKVVDIFSVGMEKERLLEYAALAESSSTHPIAVSIQKAYGREIDRTRVAKIEEISGNGVLATVDGTRVAVGNDSLMRWLGISLMGQGSTGTPVHVSVGGKYAGAIVISDVVKATSAEAIAALTAVGVKRAVMLTGDTEQVAASVAKELDIKEYRSRLLPADKVAEVERLLSELSGGERLAFVGDGINDAPVLARADVGIAMGAIGSDAAIEAADVVIMNDDPAKVARAVKISRKCLSIVRQNIVFSIAVKLASLVLVAAGIANMWFGIFADVGVMVLAVLNAVRALKVK